MKKESMKKWKKYIYIRMTNISDKLGENNKNIRESRGNA